MPRKPFQFRTSLRGKNDWFTRQKRLNRQEEDAMRELLKINESQSKKVQSYGRKDDSTGATVSPMPGVTYDEGGIVDRLLDFLKIKPRKGRFKKPKPAGRSGFI